MSTLKKDILEKQKEKENGYEVMIRSMVAAELELKQNGPQQQQQHQPVAEPTLPLPQMKELATAAASWLRDAQKDQLAKAIAELQEQLALAEDDHDQRLVARAAPHQPKPR